MAGPFSVEKNSFQDRKLHYLAKSVKAVARSAARLMRITSSSIAADPGTAFRLTDGGCGFNLMGVFSAGVMPGALGWTLGREAPCWRRTCRRAAARPRAGGRS